MNTAPEIRITVDGRLALTTAQAADRHGKTPHAMEQALKRAGVAPAARIERIPLYWATDVTATMRTRPGRGAPGVPRPHRPTT